MSEAPTQSKADGLLDLQVKRVVPIAADLAAFNLGDEAGLLAAATYGYIAGFHAGTERVLFDVTGHLNGYVDKLFEAVEASVRNGQGPFA